jgi:DNA-binding NarL/FixJ family response regulator
LTTVGHTLTDSTKKTTTNTAIATTLHISVGSAEKHTASIFTKFGLAPDESENRRVLAVLRYLET